MFLRNLRKNGFNGPHKVIHWGLECAPFVWYNDLKKEAIMADKKKQGYKARKDESIAMRKKKKRTKKQLKASRDESYGKWGSKAKKKGKINK